MLFVLACLVRGSSAMAQQDGPPPAADAKETAQLVEAIDDIDRLRSLNPLKLTVNQLDRAIALLTATQASYQKKVTALAAERVAKMGDTIRDVKQKMLVGGELPADVDKQLQQASSDFIAKRNHLDLENIAAVANSLKEILNADQVKAAAAMTRDAPVNANKSAKATEAQWFNLFVADVMLSYPRILPLLKEMRAARIGGNGPADGGSAGGNR
jgi:hypothetical protein